MLVVLFCAALAVPPARVVHLQTAAAGKGLLVGTTGDARQPHAGQADAGSRWRLSKPPKCLQRGATAQNCSKKRGELASCKTLASRNAPTAGAEVGKKPLRPVRGTSQRPERGPDTRGPLEKPFWLGSLAPKRNRVTDSTLPATKHKRATPAAAPPTYGNRAASRARTAPRCSPPRRAASCARRRI